MCAVAPCVHRRQFIWVGGDATAITRRRFDDGRQLWNLYLRFNNLPVRWSDTCAAHFLPCWQHLRSRTAIASTRVQKRRVFHQPACHFSVGLFCPPRTLWQAIENKSVLNFQFCLPGRKNNQRAIFLLPADLGLIRLQQRETFPSASSQVGRTFVQKVVFVECQRLNKIYTTHRHQTDSLLGGIWMKGKYVWAQTEKCDEKQRALAACGSIKKSSFWSAGRVSVCSYIGLLCVLELKEDAAWAAESCVCMKKR